MKQFLLELKRMFSTEWLKLKGTGMLWLCFASAAFIPLINTILFFVVYTPANVRQQYGWQSFIEQNVNGFTGFFFPLFLIITVTRIVYLEHRSDTWKLLETQPVSRFSIFFSKWVLVILISLLCICALFIFSFLGGGLLVQFKGASVFNHSQIDLTNNLKLLTRIWISSLGLISLQYLLSLMMKSFAWPLSIGLIAIIAGSILTNLLNWNWFPYSAPFISSKFSNGSNSGSFFIPHELLSLAWCAFFLWCAYQVFTKRKIARAFFSPLPRALGTVSAVIVFAVLFWLINRPVTLPTYGKTILSGTIHSDDSVDKLILLRYPAMDTAVIVPIIKGQFHQHIQSNLTHGIYLARVGVAGSEIYFGNGDSLNIEWTATKKSRTPIKFTGTRIAENIFLNDPSARYDVSYLDRYAAYYDEESFSGEYLAAWKSEQNKIENFKTVDNIKPAPDFIALEKKLLAIDLLNISEIEYPRVFAIYFPNQKLKYDTAMNQVRRVININDSSLVAYQTYRQYVASIIDKKARETRSSFLSLVPAYLTSEKVRNYITMDYVNTTLTAISDSATREAILQKSIPLITDNVLIIKLIRKNELLNHLQKGKRAPNFIAESLNGSSYGLQDFANRYLVIDVWASWCAPCKEEIPFFEQYADQYTDERIAFISISIDQDKRAWLNAVDQKSKRVLQLWTRNAQSNFADDYAVTAIPRYILIDPKGNILNAQFSRPSDPGFESDLQNEIRWLRLTSY